MRNKLYHLILLALCLEATVPFVASSADGSSAAQTTDTDTSVSKRHEWEWDKIHCDTLWTGDNDLSQGPGKICVQLVQEDSDGPQQHQLVVTYLMNNITNNDEEHRDTEYFLLEESFVWAGSDTSFIPQSRHDWPHKNTFDSANRDNYTMKIPLDNDMLSTDETATIYLAVHPVILPVRRGSNTPNNDPQSGMETEAQKVKETYLRNSAQDIDLSDVRSTARATGFWWMEFELVIQSSHHASLSSTDREEALQIVHMEQRQRRLDHTLSAAQERRRKLGYCGNEDRIPSTDDSDATSDVLTEEFLHRFHVVTALSADVAYDTFLMRRVDYYRTLYERFDAFSDGIDDVAVVAKVEDVCYAAFRGTVEFNPMDELQNFLPGYKLVDDTDCYVRKGFYEAYFTNYMTQFEESVRNCVHSCDNDEQCDLVLTGGSQGAAVAIVGGIRLFEEFDPYVMSLGVMRTFLPTSPFDDHAPCTHINKERHYHFILTDQDLQAYDPVPSFFGFWTRTVGHEILYDGEGDFNYQGLAPNYNMARTPGNWAIHTRWNYVVKTKRAYENACFPYPSRGWFDGHWCSGDENCMVTSYCTGEGKCQPKLAMGSDCENDAACFSGSCVSGTCLINVSKKQPPGLPIGETCWNDNDCGSGRCEGFWGFATCEMQLESGEECSEHSDCLSGHCAGFFNGICL